MDQRFIPLNAGLALYSPLATSWPRPLNELGYVVEVLELPLDTAEGRVEADIVAYRQGANRFILNEAKGGANVSEEQAKRYLHADTAWLIQATRVSVSGTAPSPQVQTHYICQRQHEDRILLGLAQAGVSVPVLSVGDEDIKACGATFQDPDIGAVFSEPLPVPGPPPGLITLDRESSESDFDLHVYPSIIEAMTWGVPEVSVPELAKSAVPHLDLYPTGYRNTIVRKVESAARRAAEADNQYFEYRPPTGTRQYGMIRFKASPEELDPRGRPQAYQGIANRLSSGRRRPAAAAENQGVLFGGDDLERELSQDTEGEEEA